VIEQYAFVPANGGVLSIDGALPRVAGDWDVEAIRALLPPTRYLRVAAHVQIDSDHVRRLRVFEAVDAPGTPPELVSVPAQLRPAFDRCVAELRGAPIPIERPPWARPGWHDEVEAWAGMPLEQVRSWPLSAVLRSGDLWFKAVLQPVFAHEPAVTEAVGTPRVLRSDSDRGWMIMESARGEPGDHRAAMRAIAGLHRAWLSRADDVLALGAPDRRAPSELPPTLIHGDFHPGNVVGSTVIDWSDAALANPLHDVNHYLLSVEDALRDELLAAYAEAWPGVDVPSAAAECEAETYEYVALSYARITAALAPDDRWWFAG
jgi:hypothetical protein